MRVLFAAQDPGGCDSLVPVAKGLGKHPEIKTMFIAAKKSKGVLSKASLDFIDADGLGKKDIFRLVEGFRPDKMILGTSIGPSIEKMLIDFASNNSIMSICIVDYWSNYWLRFSTSGSDRKHLPDVICVIDEMMKDEMIGVGFEPSRLRITGNPRFDSLLEDFPRSEMTDDRIVFISQPFSELKDQDIDVGYDEMEVLRDIIEAISLFNRNKKTDFSLIIRPHPKEDAQKFSGIIEEHAGVVKITIDDIADVADSLTGSRLVIGMSSIVLFHAAINDKDVISYQPHVKYDYSILDKLGISRTVKTRDGLYQMICDILVNGNKIQFDDKIIEKYFKNNSTGNVIGLIMKN